MLKLRYFASYIILISMVLVSCTTQTTIPTATETVKQTSLPTSTFTPVPISTDTPTPTPSCNADEVLKDIKANFKYSEFEVHYNSIQGTTSLALWYVDPDIDPSASGDEIEKNALLAMHNAALTSQQLANQNDCIGRLFTVINPIVVDSSYHGWFSGQVEPGILTESELEAVEDSFEIGYYRTDPPAPFQLAPSGACNWPETREKIQQHFSLERENVSFYFVIDDAGVNVWAQWDGPTDIPAFLPSMLNIAMELDCLHPSPTQLIMMTVDNNGIVGLIGILPSDGIENLDLNQLQILYYQD